ncbi:hypothetical protein FQN57_004261 [Myotisia sp. PD_48]|nr:hypothetical protein FQN57_004261 [Myotisia sp. PD_48]
MGFEGKIFSTVDDISSSPVDIEAQTSSEGVNLVRTATVPPTSPTTQPGTSGSDGLDIIRRRTKRSNTARSYYPEGSAQSPIWHPGDEPGLDPTAPELPTNFADEKHLLQESIHRRCEITVVDFSEDMMRMYHLDNDTLSPFLDRKKEPWVKCRWINVNGLSWDVVRVLANHKSLHRLAVEDLMHSVNRTKVDWFSDHTFIVLAMQKLIKLRSDHSAESSGNESDDGSDSSGTSKSSRSRSSSIRTSKTKRSVIMAALRDIFTQTSQKKRSKLRGISLNSDARHAISRPSRNGIRTLQRFRGGPNEDRIEFMERHAVLGHRGLSVGIEQVSIFLHADNTVTSFFEASAEDIEAPIIERLRSPSTILRQSCDASMVTQALLDAITDLAIPVTMAYQDAIGDLEVQVLTDPDIQQSTKLYILTSEISILRNAIQPIIGVINSLRDHRTDPSLRPQLGIKAHSSASLAANHPSSLRTTVNSGTDGVKMASTVVISLMCQTYLGDVLDHCITITEGYDQMRRSADNMIDLIFNTIGKPDVETQVLLLFYSLRKLTLLPLVN